MRRHRPVRLESVVFLGLAAIGAAAIKLALGFGTPTSRGAAVMPVLAAGTLLALALVGGLRSLGGAGRVRAVDSGPRAAADGHGSAAQDDREPSAWRPVALLVTMGLFALGLRFLGYAAVVLAVPALVVIARAGRRQPSWPALAALVAVLLLLYGIFDFILQIPVN